MVGEQKLQINVLTKRQIIAWILPDDHFHHKNIPISKEALCAEIDAE